jgi:hypothetical protein
MAQIICDSIYLNKFPYGHACEILNSKNKLFSTFASNSRIFRSDILIRQR